jgi:hypothetical protein
VPGLAPDPVPDPECLFADGVFLVLIVVILYNKLSLTLFTNEVKVVECNEITFTNEVKVVECNEITFTNEVKVVECNEITFTKVIPLASFIFLKGYFSAFKMVAK